MSTSSNRLHRSADDKIIAGVCGGLAESFNIDPTLLRLAVGLMFIATGFMPMAAIYLLLAIVMPLESGFDLEDEDARVLDHPVVLETRDEKPASFTPQEVDAWGLEETGVSAKPADSDAKGGMRASGGAS